MLSGGLVTFCRITETRAEKAVDAPKTPWMVMVLVVVSKMQFLVYTRFVVTRQTVLAPLFRMDCEGYVSLMLPSLGRGLIGVNLIV